MNFYRPVQKFGIKNLAAQLRNHTIKNRPDGGITVLHFRGLTLYLVATRGLRRGVHPRCVSTTHH